MDQPATPLTVWYRESVRRHFVRWSSGDPCGVITHLRHARWSYGHGGQGAGGVNPTSLLA